MNIDVSRRNLEFSLGFSEEDGVVDALYVYKNVFNLIPRSLCGVSRLREFKFFGNEITLFPQEVSFGDENEIVDLLGLECLQVKLSSPELNDLPFSMLKGLKELELSKPPPKANDMPFTTLNDVFRLRSLTKLSLSHFHIVYLPKEIGYLTELEYLDLSFNKIRTLPDEICRLSALVSLRVANNKLVEVPLGLSELERLEYLDLSYNKLTKLVNLELRAMLSLKGLNLQYNKIVTCCEIPEWVRCNLEGNGDDSGGSVSCNGSRCTSLDSARSRKRWTRRCDLEKRGGKECLSNGNRKCKGGDKCEELGMEEDENCKQGNVGLLDCEACVEDSSGIVVDDDVHKEILSWEAESGNLLGSGGKEDKEFSSEVCSSNSLDSSATSEVGKKECSGHEAGEQDEDSSSEVLKSAPSAKRHFDSDLDNPKPCKSQKPLADASNLSRKYSEFSFCSTEDYLQDGFYDAGRSRPFMSLSSYELNLHLDSREVILMDRERDELLDAIALSAQAFLLFHSKWVNGWISDGSEAAVDDLKIASLIALFISDHFGGSDKCSVIGKMRKAVSGSNYRKPFVCTCSTGNNNNVSSLTTPIVGNVEAHISFYDLCEKSIHFIKARRNSITVPIGALQFGVCRHRAVLMKYLCDRMEPRIPCELVRGYLDFMPHAWNIILIKRADSWVRMVVDACHPHDIKEEADPEYFCRYIPLSRTIVPLSNERSLSYSCSFPSLSTCDEIVKGAFSSLVQCELGSVVAVAKVRTLEVCSSSADEITNFEYNCLAEVRILGSLKHPCIVELYGHQISSKWVPAEDGNPSTRILQSAILMEYVKGGSLKKYLEKLSKYGEKYVPVELALCIARVVASALAELHSKHIIHRDIKSENILIDLDTKRDDGAPLVKLCDFDRAVPLRSFLHTCCIGHKGIPPPHVCVGTPRWMAPEVMRAMHGPNRYGLEVDIWSFGCLLFELLTLEVPYLGFTESEMHNLIQMGKRPPLTDKLEAMLSLNEPALVHSDEENWASEANSETLRFLVDLFNQCTKENPTDRPTAQNLHEMLLSRTSNVTSSII